MLEEVCGPREARGGMGWDAGERNIIFYAEDGKVAGRDPKWLQESLVGSGYVPQGSVVEIRVFLLNGDMISHYIVSR